MPKCFLSILALFFMGLAIHQPVQAANELEAKLESWMTANFPARNSRWEAWLMPSKHLQAGKNYYVKGIKGLKKPKKVMSFVVATNEEDDENNSEIVVVKARVVRFTKVAVARHIIRRGMLLKKKDWHVVERNAAQVPYDVILDFKILENKRTKKVLARNEVLTRHALEKRPDVATGKRLTLQVCGDGIIIKTDVTSMKEGNIGDVLEFKNCLNGQVLRGELVSTDLARIQLNRRPN